MMKNNFNSLLENYTSDKNLISTFWNEIELKYSDKNRYYHTLQHLENLHIELLKIKDKIQNWEIIQFTLFYHDIIYNSLKSDNEEKSADLAVKRMNQINISSENIELCKNLILATKTHVHSSNDDTNYFTDADLSILGKSWEVYSTYLKNVRSEYSIYPDLLYNPGRKKVLQHFLKMDRIFKTDYFYDLYENQARENIEKELLIY
jgi:predicted metal-dependent HD superfamily phosphohydrolase